MFLRRTEGDYDHLARVEEWSLTGGEDEDEEAERMNERPRPEAVIAASTTPPTRRCRPGCRPMPARARPTCWRSA